MQIDNTLIFSDQAFLEEEDKQLKIANIQAKPTIVLNPINNIDFNGYKIILGDNNYINLIQKG